MAGEPSKGAPEKNEGMTRAVPHPRSGETFRGSLSSLGGVSTAEDTLRQLSGGLGLGVMRKEQEERRVKPGAFIKHGCLDFCGNGFRGCRIGGDREPVPEKAQMVGSTGGWLLLGEEERL